MPSRSKTRKRRALKTPQRTYTASSTTSRRRQRAKRRTRVVPKTHRRKCAGVRSWKHLGGRKVSSKRKEDERYINSNILSGLNGNRQHLFECHINGGVEIAQIYTEMDDKYVYINYNDDTGWHYYPKSRLEFPKDETHLIIFKRRFFNSKITYKSNLFVPNSENYEKIKYLCSPGDDAPVDDAENVVSVEDRIESFVQRGVNVSETSNIYNYHTLWKAAIIHNFQVQKDKLEKKIDKLIKQDNAKKNYYIKLLKKDEKCATYKSHINYRLVSLSKDV